MSILLDHCFVEGVEVLLEQVLRHPDTTVVLVVSKTVVSGYRSNWILVIKVISHVLCTIAYQTSC